MSNEVIGLIGLLVLIFLIFIRMNIAISMTAIGFFGYCWIGGFDMGMAMFGSTTFTTLASYSISVIPLFIFMGAVISQSGMGNQIYKSAHTWFGHLRGGLAYSTVVACAIFAALCGSSMAETVTIGRIVLPEMKKYRYKETLATGCIASAGSLATMIPPSIGLLVYGILTEQPVGTLFIAGIVPGIILTLFLMGTVTVITRIDPESGPSGERSSWGARFKDMKLIGPISVLLLLVLGGIYAGIFTPTEAGAMGAFGAIIITFISRYLTRDSMMRSIIEAGETTAMLLSLIVGAFVFMKFMTISNLSIFLPAYIKQLGLSPMGTIIMLVVFYLFCGMFFDILAAMVLTIPIVFPIITSLGFDPIWFGILLVVLQELGLITPPIGMNIFLLSAVTEVPITEIYKGIFPFAIAIGVFLILLIIFPQIALVLPNMMNK